MRFFNASQSINPIKEVKKMLEMNGRARSCREMAHFPNTETLFSTYKERVKCFKKENAEDLIPHNVLSHGFMEWCWLLCSQFPCFAWRGKNTEGADGFIFEEYQKVLYDRFFLEMAERVFQDSSEEERKKFKEEGWREYLDD